jgi:hypothetical protein
LTSKERLEQTTTLLFGPSISRLVEISEVGDKRMLCRPLLCGFTRTILTAPDRA